MTTWHKGPPPSIGWWPASFCREPAILRWWNGVWWSVGCISGYEMQTVARDVTVKSKFQDEIEWTDRPASWPERSRT
jgi:hypothetical protein